MRRAFAPDEEARRFLERHALREMQLPLPPEAEFGGLAYRVASCGSSLDLMNEMQRLGFPHGTVLLADEQTQGRGRRGSAWFSSPENLQLALLLRPQLRGAADAAQLPFLNVLVSYAILKTLYLRHRLPAMLKWPNDILVAGRKICGVLSEMRGAAAAGEHSEPAKPVSIVVGVGLNMNLPRQEFPAELRSGVTSIFTETGEHSDPQTLLTALLSTLEELYKSYNSL